MTPPPLPVGTFLLINTLPPNLPWKASGIVEQPRVGGWNADHPVLRHVNLNEVHIARSLNFEAPVESRLASDMRGRPLITLYDDGSLRFVQLGFDLMETDLPLRVAFPIFMSNVLRWANPNSLRFSAKMVQTGEAALLAIPPNATSLTLLRPDGERQRLAVQDQLNLRYEATNRAGIYRWQAGKRLRAFAANLLDPRESDIAPKSHPAWTQPHAVIGAGVVHTTSRAYWYALLLFAVLALCVEWWVWCREG